ncbi:MAG: universal stress protein [Pseudomonadota bacterium]
MKILVATDGSKCALNAVKYAAQLAVSLHSTDRITLINVHDDSALRHAKKLLGKTSVEEYLRSLSEKEVKPAVEVLKNSGVPYDIVIKFGHIAEHILKTAAAGKYDLIILGAKGRTAFADLLLGSVAQRVLSTAKQAVLLVK